MMNKIMFISLAMTCLFMVLSFVSIGTYQVLGGNEILKVIGIVFGFLATLGMLVVVIALIIDIIKNS